jgi:diguanylate cyclase (GGDEF)-like protein
VNTALSKSWRPAAAPALARFRAHLPKDRLVRVRLVFLVFSEASAGLLLLVLALELHGTGSTAAGAVALAALAAKWATDYRHPGRHALWDLGEAALLLLAGIATQSPLAILLLLYARVSAIAVDSGNGRAALASLDCAAAFLGACALAPHTAGITVEDGFLATGFPLAAAVMRMLGDILDRRTEEGLRHLAYHDALTGLPNRAMLSERAEHALRRTAGRTTRRPVMMMLDLDGFKTVNDAVGHAAGDEVIAAVARRISACLRPGDVAARMGGDEFAVLLEDVADAVEAIGVAERLIEAISAPHRAAGRVLPLSACVGVAACSGPATTLRDLISDADLAMYVAKARGRAAVQVFTPELRTAQMERQRMQEQLQEALRRGEMRVVYQPQVDVASRRVTGAEALVRWDNPEYGAVPPDVFIPMAEQLGLVTEIDRWVLHTACADLAGWRESGHETLRVAVNISGHDLDSAALVDDVRRTLLAGMLDAWQLELELTESVAVQQPEAAVRLLHDLRATGVRVAIDDFGTGYSMLSRLRALPIDRLKIDRSFVRDLSWDDDAAAIVQSTVTMGHALGLTLVAEGVESEEVLERLLDLGCDSAQGFHICSPLPAAEFEAWLATTHWRVARVAEAVG